ncbi:MAG: extracellular solute-binding protein [Parvularculaceae bacterium]|nr:extracellular solute-binding protein [Parvularculaceae bacterium]
MSIVIRAALAASLCVLAASCGQEGGKSKTGAPAPTAAAGEVNIYSARHYDSDLDVYAAFTKATGIKVNIVEAGGDELIERLAREKAASPADLFITADAGILWRAEERGLFQPITDAAALSRVDRHFRDGKNLWIGVTKRVRVVIYDKAKGLPEGIATYADLAKPAFKGMICARPSSNVYNQSLLASIIAHDGAAAAEAWAKGVVANFARPPQGSDTTQIEGVAAGDCRLAMVNSYYVARYMNAGDAKKAAIGAKIGVFYPNQETTGAHVNISGVGLTAHAPNRANAEKLIDFLLSDEAQDDFARGNNEYPIVPAVKPEGPIATLGAFKEDALPVDALGENQPEAIRIFDRAGWR